MEVSGGESLTVSVDGGAVGGEGDPASADGASEEDGVVTAGAGVGGERAGEEEDGGRGDGRGNVCIPPSVPGGPGVNASRFFPDCQDQAKGLAEGVEGIGAGGLAIKDVAGGVFGDVGAGGEGENAETGGLPIVIDQRREREGQRVGPAACAAVVSVQDVRDGQVLDL